LKRLFRSQAITATHRGAEERLRADLKFAEQSKYVMVTVSAADLGLVLGRMERADRRSVAEGRISAEDDAHVNERARLELAHSPSNIQAAKPQNEVLKAELMAADEIILVAKVAAGRIKVSIERNKKIPVRDMKAFLDMHETMYSWALRVRRLLV
jgi:hypothetical protein